jgi:uncharacterized protein (TIGR00369 family)
MAIRPNSSEMARAQLEMVGQGAHLLQQLGIRDVPSAEGRLAIEMDIRPEFANIRGALQGGLIAVLIDICAGRLAYASCDHEQGYSTATSDLTVHYLSPVAVGPARTEARVVGRGPTSFVLEVEVTDVGRDDRLAATSTVAFQVLAPR